MVTLSAARLKIPQRRLVLDDFETALPPNRRLTWKRAEWGRWGRPIVVAQHGTFGNSVSTRTRLRRRCSRWKWTRNRDWIGNVMGACVDVLPEIEMHVDVLIRKDFSHRIQSRLLGQVRMQKSTSGAIQIAQVVEFDKNILFERIGSRESDPLPAHSVGIALVALGVLLLPNVQQAIAVGVLNRRAEN